MTDQAGDALEHILEQTGADSVEDVLAIEDAANVFSGYASNQQRLQTLTGGASAGDLLGSIEELKELKSAISRLTAAVEGNTKQGLASTTVVREAASLNTVDERKKYLHGTLSVTGDLEAAEWSDTKTVAGYALKRANALFKARHGGVEEIVPDAAPSGWTDPREHAALWNARRVGNGDFKTVQVATDQDSFWSKRAVNRSDWRIANLSKYGAGGGFNKAGKEGQAYIDQNPFDKGAIPELGKAALFTSQQLVALGKVVSAVADNYDKIFQAHQTADKAVYGAASYFVPRFARGAADRYFSAYQAFEQTTHLGRSKWLHLGGDMLQSLGHAKGGNGGAAGTSFFNGIGDFVSRSIMQKGFDKVSRPAIRRWGILPMSMNIGSPVISLPRQA